MYARYNFSDIYKIYTIIQMQKYTQVYKNKSVYKKVYKGIQENTNVCINTYKHKTYIFLYISVQMYIYYCTFPQNYTKNIYFCSEIQKKKIISTNLYKKYARHTNALWYKIQCNIHRRCI